MFGLQPFVADFRAFAGAISINPPKGVPQFQVLLVSLAEFLLCPIEGRSSPPLCLLKTTILGYFCKRFIEFFFIYVPTHSSSSRLRKPRTVDGVSDSIFIQAFSASSRLKHVQVPTHCCGELHSAYQPRWSGCSW